MSKYYAVGLPVKVMTTSFIIGWPEKELELNEQHIKDSLRPKKNPALPVKMFENLEQAKQYASLKSETNISGCTYFTNFTPVVEVTVADNAQATLRSENVFPIKGSSESLNFNYLLINADKIETAHSYFYESGVKGKKTTVAREFSFREVEQTSSCTIM